VHLFLIPIEPAIDDSQMIFVLWKHTLFAAGAKLCDTAKKLIGSTTKSRWDRALRLVGSTLVSTAATIQARSIRCVRQSAQAKVHGRARASFAVAKRAAGHLRAAATDWHNPYTLAG